MAQPTTTSQERGLTLIRLNFTDLEHLEHIVAKKKEKRKIVKMLNSLAVRGDGIAAEQRPLIWRLRFGRDGEPFGAVVPHDKVIHHDGGEEDEEDNPARRESGAQRRHEGSVQLYV